jgi:hypothetical protein
LNNACANAKINAYFQEGKLPGHDNFCSLEAGPFGIVLPGRLDMQSDYKEIRDKMKNVLRI